MKRILSIILVLLLAMSIFMTADTSMFATQSGD